MARPFFFKRPQIGFALQGEQIIKTVTCLTVAALIGSTEGPRKCCSGINAPHCWSLMDFQAHGALFPPPPLPRCRAVTAKTAPCAEVGFDIWSGLAGETPPSPHPTCMRPSSFSAGYWGRSTAAGKYVKRHLRTLHEASASTARETHLVNKAALCAAPPHN